MANGLLDFVMSLVRDPDVAAQYAADPAQAIADAHLTDVTSADVNNLIPMVSDSLSSFPGAASSFGGDTAHDANVWTSGAATAAFDAFTPQIADLPDHATAAVHDLPSSVINSPTLTQPDLSQIGGHELAGLDSFDPSNQLDDIGIDPAAVDVGNFAIDDHGVWDHLNADVHHVDADPSGFDLLH
jgi:hypothetical protein